MHLTSKFRFSHSFGSYIGTLSSNYFPNLSCHLFPFFVSSYKLVVSHIYFFRNKRSLDSDNKILRPFSSWMMIPKSAQIQMHWTCGKNWVGRSSLLLSKPAVNLWRARDWHRNSWNSHRPVGYCTLVSKKCPKKQRNIWKTNKWTP